MYVHTHMHSQMERKDITEVKPMPFSADNINISSCQNINSRNDGNVIGNLSEKVVA